LLHNMEPSESLLIKNNASRLGHYFIVIGEIRGSQFGVGEPLARNRAEGQQKPPRSFSPRLLNRNTSSSRYRNR
jgi:hypothetical protein